MSSEAREGEAMSEYEKSVRENIQELHSTHSELFEKVTQSADNLAKSTSSQDNNGIKRRRNIQHWRPIKMSSSKLGSSTKNVEVVRRRSTRRSKKTKNVTKCNEESDGDDNKIKKRGDGERLYVKFPWCNNNQEKDYNSFDDSDLVNGVVNETKRRRPVKLRAVRTARLAVSQVTQNMLDGIMYSSTGKIYCASGTTCHQCRQKTTDQKTYCRYKGCTGVRGMFCGFCLKNRYGEDVADALKNPKWACPPCRNDCNCSICRRKLGLNPTGQLIQQAICNGYRSVKHMLCHDEGENSNRIATNIDDDDDENFVGDENAEETERVECETVDKKD